MYDFNWKILSYNHIKKVIIIGKMYNNLFYEYFDSPNKGLIFMHCAWY